MKISKAIKPLLLSSLITSSSGLNSKAEGLVYLSFDAPDTGTPRIYTIYAGTDPKHIFPVTANNANNIDASAWTSFSQVEIPYGRNEVTYYYGVNCTDNSNNVSSMSDIISYNPSEDPFALDKSNFLTTDASLSINPFDQILDKSHITLEGIIKGRFRGFIAKGDINNFNRKLKYGEDSSQEPQDDRVYNWTYDIYPTGKKPQINLILIQPDGRSSTNTLDFIINDNTPPNFTINTYPTKTLYQFFSISGTCSEPYSQIKVNGKIRDSMFYDSFMWHLNLKLAPGLNTPNISFTDLAGNESSVTLNIECDDGHDSDADGLTDMFEELRSHTDPLNSDSDKDGMSDREEIIYGFNPNDPEEKLFLDYFPNLDQRSLLLGFRIPEKFDSDNRGSIFLNRIKQLSPTHYNKERIARFEQRKVIKPIEGENLELPYIDPTKPEFLETNEIIAKRVESPEDISLIQTDSNSGNVTISIPLTLRYPENENSYYFLSIEDDDP